MSKWKKTYENVISYPISHQENENENEISLLIY